MVYFRIVEINRAYDPWFGIGKGWIYASNQIEDYRAAILGAIAHENKTGLKTWVELIT